MKNLIRSLFATAALTLLALTSFASPNEPGAIDVGELMPSANGEFVEVNLSSAMLKFAAKLTSRHEPEAAELIANLKSIRVNVVSTDEGNRNDTIAKIEAVRRKLEIQGWTKVVTVREKNRGDNVDVHVKQHGEDTVDGLVVTVIDRSGQAVFVNIVGNINADQISKIAEKFNIDPLRKVPTKTVVASSAVEV